jgi:hypothetical protein
MVGSSLVCKYLTRVEVNSSGKRSSLLDSITSLIGFIVQDPGAIFTVLTNGFNKLEGFYLKASRV